MITRRTTQVVARSTMPWSVTQWRPKASPEGPREAGSTRVGDATTALMDDWAVHPAAGSHLPSEDTAPPFAVAFPSSPFAHPIATKPSSRPRGICSEVPRVYYCSISLMIMFRRSAERGLDCEKRF